MDPFRIFQFGKTFYWQNIHVGAAGTYCICISVSEAFTVFRWLKFLLVCFYLKSHWEINNIAMSGLNVYMQGAMIKETEWCWMFSSRACVALNSHVHSCHNVSANTYTKFLRRWHWKASQYTGLTINAESVTPNHFDMQGGGGGVHNLCR